MCVHTHTHTCVCACVCTAAWQKFRRNSSRGVRTGMPRTGTHTLADAHTHTHVTQRPAQAPPCTQANLGNEAVGTHPLATQHVIPASLHEAAVAISKPTHIQFTTQREECSSTIVLTGAADEQDGLRGRGYSYRYEPWGIGVVLDGTFASALVANVAGMPHLILHSRCGTSRS